MEFEVPRQIFMIVLLVVVLLIVVLLILALQGSDTLNLSKIFGFLRIFG